MLTDKEKADVIAFLDNEERVEAVKKAMLQELIGHYEWVFDIDRGKPNEEYGEAVKIRAEAIRELEGAFKRLYRMKDDRKDTNTKNPAR